jgi:hypothetical protein
MNGNTYYHSDSCNLPNLEELFKEKPHPGVLLKGRRWRRIRARINRFRKK